VGQAALAIKTRDSGLSTGVETKKLGRVINKMALLPVEKGVTPPTRNCSLQRVLKPKLNFK